MLSKYFLGIVPEIFNESAVNLDLLAVGFVGNRSSFNIYFLDILNFKDSYQAHEVNS